MARSRNARFGELAPRYRFVLNPYPEERLSSCPLCSKRTGQRTLPLMIHVDPTYPVALNYRCRYCSACDLLIAHKHEIEGLLTTLFRQRQPEVVGNDYLVLGTLDKKAWQDGSRGVRTLQMGNIRAYVHDFVLVYTDMTVTRGGWYPEGEEPPLLEPPPSRDWVRSPRPDA